MMWRSHLVMGLGAGYLVSGFDPVLLAAAGLGSLLPDLDHPNSWIGSRIPILPTIARGVLGHRGALHSLAATLALGGIIGLLWGREIGLAMAAGYLAHLAGDMLTLSGVPLLWPLPVMVRIPLVKTGGLLERFVVFPALTLGLVYWAVLPEVSGYVGRVMAWLT
ncbi:metal-dependent hydrolase [Desulforamulus ruminis]|uniref:Membrane-bound metal-dependent hydrolase n=1 Tax=Desulforamulus ruminis (strain ATCC 23193 / DSM 2154 / NCIMB 8452 / DL) TaxID=696281 RepID=F6DTV8_DESRL|nr:metal-dependent hydrolase [Desulforamulus ruminis]AEG58976.1 membrane-bound metal-dependent hydrolase [Desulforamulus ruminis DSM 2154]